MAHIYFLALVPANRLGKFTNADANGQEGSLETNCEMIASPKVELAFLFLPVDKFSLNLWIPRL